MDELRKMSIDAMKQALEALETCKVHDEADAWFDIDKVEEAVDALRLAIEQAERQEPVATLFGTLPVYDAAPPQRQPLSLNNYLNDADISAADMPHKVVQKLQAAIDRAHGIGGAHD